MNSAEIADAYGLHRLPYEVAPSLLMIGEILSTVEQWLAESGCPLTPDQVAAFAAARRVLASEDPS